MSTITLLCDQASKTYTVQFQSPKRGVKKVLGNLERDGKSLRQFHVAWFPIILRGIQYKRIRICVGSSGGSITFTWK